VLSAIQRQLLSGGTSILFLRRFSAFQPSRSAKDDLFRSFEMQKIMRSFPTTWNWRQAIAVLAYVSAMTLACRVGFAASQNPPADQPAGSRTERGDAIFHKRCVVCHNKQPGNTSPFGPPNLYDLFREKKLTLAEAAPIIHHGKGQMPAFGTTITDAEIADVVAYLKSR
jgi:mono/diheme cytochrome c family protein